MENLKKEIERLERKVLVQKAYLGLEVKWGKKSSIPDDIKKEVSDNIKRLALLEAERSDDDGRSKFFTDNEVEILKELVRQIESRKSKPEIVNTPNNVNNEKSEDSAVLITLDNVPRKQRGKISPQSVVKIMDRRNNMAFVQDEFGNRFFVPLDDLNFIEGST